MVTSPDIIIFQNIDLLIVFTISLVILIVGIAKGQEVQSIKEFAIGKRSFSTTALVCTVVATWVGGDDFFIFISESYQHGLYFILSYILGTTTVLIITAVIFIPRMKEFMGKLSIAEAMGDLFGTKVRLVSSIAGILGTLGAIAAQFKIAGLLFEYSFGVANFYGIIIGALIVITYSTFGGIKSVTFTDVIQLFLFGAVVPTLAFFIFGTLENADNIFKVLSNNQNFDFNEIITFSNSKSIYYLFFFLYVAIPGFDPTIFQRISMAKNIIQAKKTFLIAAIVFFTLSLTISWIGIVAISIYPNQPAEQITKNIIMDYSYTGLRGLTIGGILAMLMSTADSYINSASILFTHDFCKSTRIKLKNELLASRVITFLIGLLSLILSLSKENLLDLVITTASFYMPIVSVPFMFATLGFRSTSKSVLTGMSAGFITVVIWEVFFRKSTVDSIIPGMIANLFFLFTTHYLLKQSNGWIGIGDYSSIYSIRENRTRLIKRFIDTIKKFKLINFCETNSPKHDSQYVHFGLFCIISTYFSIYTTSYQYKDQYKEVIDFIYPSVFFIATFLMSYPLWTSYLRKLRVMPIIWNFSLLYILVIVATIQLMMNNFNNFQLMILMLNLVVLSALTSWKIGIIMILSGLSIGVQFFKYYSEEEIFNQNLENIQFTILYLLLFMSTILITFFKPKEDKERITQKKVRTYAERIHDQEEEITRLGATAEKILNNVNHELRLPVGNVMNFSEMVRAGLGKYSNEQIEMLTSEIYKNSNRLSSMILNMLDLAMLDTRQVKLKKTRINFSGLVEERINDCLHVYTEKEEIDFNLDIEQDISIEVDENYMRQVVDNLIVNAMKHSKESPITIKLKKSRQVLSFEISNIGDQIPHRELYDVFTAFKMTSPTEKKSEGRGIGLTLCKAAVEAHGGMIIAENHDNGARFRFTLPF